MAEAIATAQRLTGKQVIDAADMRRGLENLDLSEARLKELGLAGIMPPDPDLVRRPLGRARGLHAGMGRHALAGRLRLVPADADLVRPMLEQAAQDYVKANQPWPARTEACG